MKNTESDGFYYLGKTKDLMKKGDKIGPANSPELWGRINKERIISGHKVVSMYTKGESHEAKG